ncbi:MAG TPA: hypothetical protein VGB22_08770 [candidate division Zixibacteria bacterium]|jgi:hypothetical protein
MTHKSVFAVFAGLLLSTGCGDGPTGPPGPDVRISVDRFRYTADEMINVTDTIDYEWDFNGTTASVTQSCDITDGSAMLIILDADSTQVYSRDLDDDGTISTLSGSAGNWLVRIELIGLSGKLEFEAEKSG